MSVENLSDKELIEYYKLFEKVISNSPSRAENVKNQNYDYKFAYHLVRLINEVEQILVEGDLDLQRNKEQLKTIRKGEWKLEEIEQYFTEKEKALEKVYLESKAVPQKVREDEIKQLLVNCLEHHYGSIEKALPTQDKADKALLKIKNILDKHYL